jgi:hypothetical protein
MLQRLILVLSVFFNTLIFAQTYPVQVNPQLIPPYSLKISDYATTTSEKLYVNILLTDVNEIGRRVRLKMYIEGQGLAITTQNVIIGATPIYIDGGINTRLSNVDLQAYFQLNNLVGITPQQYNSPLPNGGYDFCFEVFDYFTNRKLSGKNCTTAYLLQNDPPILNLPFNDNIVNATNPQNVLFTWTPRHSNVSNVQYEYTLKELWDTQNPQASFLASVPFYQTNTYSTTLLVGPEAPQLLSGKIYGWQVRAFVSDGINETSVFKNDGKSEIFWFKYLEDCKEPGFVISQALTAESVQVNWQVSDHLRYRIQYRKKGFGDDDWFDVNSYTNEGKILNLEANTVYEFRVGGECTQLSGFAYSNIQEFTTPTTDEAAYYNCGLTPQIEITNNDPLPKLGINETFTAGDFPVITREVTGSNGNFSGWGYITLPFLENLKEIIDAVNILTDDGTEKNEDNINIGKYTRIKVVFSGVSVNTSYQLTKGVVVTDYDPDWKGILDVDQVLDDVFGDDGEISDFDAGNISIDDITVDADGTVIIHPTGGEPFPIDVKKPTVITDKDGKQWTIDEDGNVTEGVVADGGVPNKNNTEGISSSGNVTEISSKDVSVKFIASGYYNTDTHNDAISSSKYKNQYEFINTHDNKEYPVLYKLISDVSEHRTDAIKAEVTFANGKTKDDVVFKTIKGSKIQASWSGDVATLELNKQFSFAKDEILATVKPKDSTGKYTIAGKLNTWHAQQRNINLTLVSVDGASTSSAGRRINEIYNKAGVHFNVVTDTLTLNLKNLDVGDSDMISHYTNDEKGIISAFKDRGTKKDQYYLFFLNDGVTLSKDLDGFMPLKRQFGFVFTNEDPGRIAAHEIGHGIFGLKHPWDQYNTKKGESTYLMDSGTTGTDFTHMDWQKLHAPGIQLYLFQGDEAGESATVVNMESLKKFANRNNSFTFFTLSGKTITLPSTISSVTFSTGENINTSGCNSTDFKIQPIGALIAFEDKKKKYTARWTCSNSKFLYFKNEKDEIYEDKYSKSTWEEIDQVIIGFPVIENYDIFFKVKSFQSSILSEADLSYISSKEKYYASGTIVPYDYYFSFFKENNSNVNETSENIYAVLTPDFTPSIKRFLTSNSLGETDINGEEINNYKEDAYLFIHANQLQKYQWMESCFTKDIPNTLFSGLIGFYWKDDVKVKEINDVIDNRQLAKTIVEYWKNGNYIYPLFNEYSSKLNTISSITSSSEILKILKLIGRYDVDNNKCLWDKISLENKKHILRVFAKENFGDVKLDIENYLLDVFKSIDDSDGGDFLKLLEEEDYKVLRYLWNVENGIFSTLQEAELIGIITTWFVKDKNRVSEGYVDKAYKDYQSNYVNAKEPKPERIDLVEGLNYLPFYDADWFEQVSFFNIYDLDTEFKFSTESNIDVKLATNFIDYNNPNVFQGKKEIYKRTLKPFSPLVLEFVDGIKLNGRSFKKGSKIAVPAIFLEWLSTNDKFKENVVAVRVIGDVIAIALAAPTFGASTALFYVEVTAASIDIAFAIYEEEIAKELGPEVVQVWNSMYDIYNVCYLTSAMANLLEYTLNSSSKITNIKINYNKIDDFVADIKTQSLTKQKEILKNIDKAIDGFKSIKGYANTSEVFKVMLEVRFKVLSNLTDASTSLKIDQLNLIVTRNSNTISLAKVDVKYGNPTLIDNIRFLPETISTNELTVLGKINDINYIKEGVIKVGDFQIVQHLTNKNQFYLKLLSSSQLNFYSSGAALRSYLNAIPDTDLPVGTVLSEDIFRSLSKIAEKEYKALPDEMTDHTVYSSHGRYDLDQEENAMYLSQTIKGNETEITHYGNWLDFNTYRFPDVELTKLLDLTSPEILKKLKTLKEQLLLTDGSNNIIYEFTNELASWARSKSYNGIIAWGARGAQNYKNVIIFKQDYINNVLKGKQVKVDKLDLDNLFPLIKNHPDFQGFKNLCTNNPKVSIKLADSEWTEFVTNTKSTFGIGSKRNIVKMEFDGKEYLIASGKGYNGQMTGSGKFIPEEFVLDIDKGQRVFTPSISTRHLDTESLGLEYFAKSKNAVKDGVYPEVTGKVKITSDLCPCPSCSVIFQQFSDMFPNVTIDITTTTKLHY